MSSNVACSGWIDPSGAGCDCALHIESMEATFSSDNLLQFNHSLLVTSRVRLIASTVPFQELVGVVWREVLSKLAMTRDLL